MLVSAEKMLKDAVAGGYAVAQFNINNLEWTKEILLECEELKSPVILGVSMGAAKYMTGYKTVVAMVSAMVESLDGSSLPLEENIEKTKDLIAICQEKGISLEAEVGGIGGEEDGVVSTGECADPAECKQINDLGVTMLACGIGNIHGKYPANWAGLQFNVLESIKAVVGDRPLVLHGGSGIPDEQIQKAISMGVAKVNVNTELQLVFADATRKYIEAGKDLEGKGYDPRKLLAPGAAAIREEVKNRVAVFGSANRA